LEKRYEELSAQLSLPEVVNDREKYQQAGRRSAFWKPR